MSEKTVKQTTLFQSWGHVKQGTSSGAVARGPSSTTTGSGCAFEKFDGHSDTKKDSDFYEDVLDDLDDEALLAAAMEMDNVATEQQSTSAHGQNCVPTTGLPLPDSTPGTDKHYSTETNIPGFDYSAGNMWIYPTNYPVRDYQFNIVQRALFKNTMVTLPTGLGKTFIAAVVMYNFYRWYPQGKIVFMAPTKPLVGQQIEACYNIMGIPQQHTAEMTGSMPPSERLRAWKQKRVFFLTPQVMTNDISRGACPSQDIKCLVVDEAHKALGNHAYCQVVKELIRYTQQFRVLALSATPGSDMKQVQEVLNNLLIAHVEIRSEDAIDIKPYVHERKVEKIVVKLDDEIKDVKDQYVKILTEYVNRLIKNHVLYKREVTSLSKFMILKAREEFRCNPPTNIQGKSQQGMIEGDFAMCISLYHGYELLFQHGMRSLYLFLQSMIDGSKGVSRARSELSRNANFGALLDALREKYGHEGSANTNVSGLFSGPGGTSSTTQTEKLFVVSHPKMGKLREVVLEHFQKWDQGNSSEGTVKDIASTRIMIFSQYRDSVQEITDMLNQHQPSVRVMSFVGQASAGKNTKGFTQKEQLRVVKAFREGGYNTLVSTCVGEEGLDIGDVDLIICYDAHKSPIRLVQRMGRTGRKRQGRIVMLVTEGKEESIYNQSQLNKRSIHRAMKGNKAMILYPHNPGMLPPDVNPVVHRMHITVEKYQSKAQTKKKSAMEKRGFGGNIKSLLSKGKKSRKESWFLTQEEFKYWNEHYKVSGKIQEIPTGGEMISLRTGSVDDRKDYVEDTGGKVSLTEWTEWQNTKQPTKLISHSQQCCSFVDLMEFIDIQRQIGNEDHYSLEMMTYLNMDDVLQPGGQKRQVGIEQYCVQENVCQRDDGNVKRVQNRKRTKKKAVIIVESSDDSDLADVFAVTKTTKVAEESSDNNDVGDDTRKVKERERTNSDRCKNAKKREKQSAAIGIIPIGIETDSDFQTDVFGVSDDKLQTEKRTISDGETSCRMRDDEKKTSPCEGSGGQRVTGKEGTSCQDDMDDGFNSDKEQIDNRDESSTGQRSPSDCLDPSFIFPSLSQHPRQQHPEGGLTAGRRDDCLVALPPSPDALSDIDDLDALETTLPISRDDCTDKRCDDIVNYKECTIDDPVPDICRTETDPESDRSKLQNITDSAKRGEFQCTLQNGKTAPNGSESGVQHDNTDWGGDVEFDSFEKDGKAGDVTSVSKNDVTLVNFEKDGKAGDVTGVSKRNPLIEDRNALIMDSKVCDHEVAYPIDEDEDPDCFEVLTPQVSSCLNEHLQTGKKIVGDAEKSPKMQMNADCVKSTCKQDEETTVKDLSSLNATSTKQQNPAGSETSKSCSTGKENGSDFDLAMKATGEEDGESFACKARREAYFKENQSFEPIFDLNLNLADLDESNSDDDDHNTNDESSDARPSFLSNRLSTAKKVDPHLPKITPQVRKEVMQPTACGDNRQSVQFTKVKPKYCHLNGFVKEDSEETSEHTNPALISTRPENMNGQNKLSVKSKKLSFRGHGALPSECDSILDQTSVCVQQQRNGVKRKSYSPTVDKVKLDDYKRRKSSSPIGSPVHVAMTGGFPRTPGTTTNETVGREVNTLTTNKCSTPIAKLLPTRMLSVMSPVSAAMTACKTTDSDSDDSIVFGKRKRKKVHALQSPETPSSVTRKSTDTCTPVIRKRTPDQTTLVPPFTSVIDSEDEFDSPICPGTRKHISPRDFLGSIIKDGTGNHQARKYQTSKATKEINLLQKKTKKKVRHDSEIVRGFLEEEADVSCDIDEFSSDENEDEMDTSMEEFINDATQVSPDGMRQVYAKSLHQERLKSEVCDAVGNRYKMVYTNQEEDDMCIFSQVPVQDQSYEEDGFVVGNVEEEEDGVHGNSRSAVSAFECTINPDNIVAGKRRTRGRLAYGSRELGTKEKPGSKLGGRIIRPDSSSSDEDEFEAFVCSSFGSAQNNGGPVAASASRFIGHSLAKETLDVSAKWESKTGLKTRQERSNEVSRTAQTGCLQKSALNSAAKQCSGGESALNSAAKQCSGGERQALATNTFLLNKNTVKDASVTQQLQREERLKRQREKQLLFKRKMEESRGLHKHADKMSSLESHQQSVSLLPMNTTCNDEPKRESGPVESATSTEAAVKGGKPVVLVDSREISSSNIVSTLRCKHQVEVLVCQLTGCDYAFSQRIGVERKAWADFANVANKAKLLDKIRHLCEMYERPCIIIEKDRVKPQDEKPKPLVRSKYIDSTLAALADTHIKVIYSDSQDESAAILADLAKLEQRKGNALIGLPQMSPSTEQVLKWYTSIPRVSYITALMMLKSFTSITDMIHSSPERLQKTLGIAESKAKEIHQYVCHVLDLQMLAIK